MLAEIDLGTLRLLVPAYVADIETGETKDICICTWIDNLLGDGPKLRTDTHPECQQHTKEGFLLGFFKWMGHTVPNDEEVN